MMRAVTVRLKKLSREVPFVILEHSGGLHYKYYAIFADDYKTLCDYGRIFYDGLKPHNRDIITMFNRARLAKNDEWALRREKLDKGYKVVLEGTLDVSEF